MDRTNGNAADYFIERHLREGRGERLAFADPWRSLTYAGLSGASARVAAGLQAAGIEPERRSALWRLHALASRIAFGGAWRAGLVPGPLNPLPPADFPESLRRDSRPGGWVASEPLLEPLRPMLGRLPGLRQIIVSQPN